MSKELGISSTKRLQIIGNSIIGVNGSTTITSTVIGTVSTTEVSTELSFNSGEYKYIGLVFWNNYTGTALLTDTEWHINDIQLEERYFC